MSINLNGYATMNQLLQIIAVDAQGQPDEQAVLDLLCQRLFQLDLAATVAAYEHSVGGAPTEHRSEKSDYPIFRPESIEGVQAMIQRWGESRVALDTIAGKLTEGASWFTPQGVLDKFMADFLGTGAYYANTVAAYRQLTSG